MKAKLFLTMVAGIAMAACNQAPQQTSGLHLEYMDQTQKPGTDFYHSHAGPGWSC